MEEVSEVNHDESLNKCHPSEGDVYQNSQIFLALL